MAAANRVALERPGVGTTAEKVTSWVRESTPNGVGTALRADSPWPSMTWQMKQKQKNRRPRPIAQGTSAEESLGER